MPRHRAPDPGELRRFLNALAAIESGGRYDARNASSGARGRYQIMPANWPSWAARYLGNARADPWLPRNQDRVAAGRVTDYYRSHGSWEAVAAGWLGGPFVAAANPSSWSSSIRSYVRKVMDRFERYGGDGGGGGSVDVPTGVPVNFPTAAPVPPGCTPIAGAALALALALVAS